jgi:hypothetical protein
VLDIVTVAAVVVVHVCIIRLPVISTMLYSKVAAERRIIKSIEKGKYVNTVSFTLKVSPGDFFFISAYN